MAKYVLLTFERDAEADEFAEMVKHGDVGVYVSRREGDPHAWQKVFCKLRGVFKKPTKFCSCTSTRKRGFTRGRKYGWWVCSMCGRPTQGWASLDGLYHVLGFNLLPKDADAPEYRGDGNWVPGEAAAGRIGQGVSNE